MVWTPTSQSWRMLWLPGLKHGLKSTPNGQIDTTYEIQAEG
jgi:hypothetical protein